MCPNQRKSSIGLPLMACLLTLVSYSVWLAQASAPAESKAVQPHIEKEDTTQSSLEASFIEREEHRWAAIKGGDNQAFAELLAPDFLFVSGNGVLAKPETVKIMASLTFREHTLTDFKVLMIDSDTAIMTYTASGMASFGGREPYAFNERHSSAWVLREGKWLCVYHHYSPIPKR
jgi:hypothetical protein